MRCELNSKTQQNQNSTSSTSPSIMALSLMEEKQRTTEIAKDRLHMGTLNGLPSLSAQRRGKDCSVLPAISTYGQKTYHQAQPLGHTNTVIPHKGCHLHLLPPVFSPFHLPQPRARQDSSSKTWRQHLPHPSKYLILQWKITGAPMLPAPTAAML